MADIPSDTDPAMNGQVSLSTRLKVWWDATPLVTRGVFAVCTAIYAVGLLTGWDNLGAVCLAPDALLSFQLYRLLTSAVFHAGLLHLTFNMMAFLPIGSSLERALGSVQLLCLILLVIFLGDSAYIAMAYAAAVARLPAFMAQCAVGFSGVVFGLIVVDNHASGAAVRSIFGLCAVPARAYPWVLLLFWSLLVPQVSFLGHLSGLLVGQLYVWGWLRWAVPSAPTVHAVEHSALASRWLTPLPAFIVHTGGGAFDALPVSRQAGGGAESAGTGQGWWRGPWMPYPSGYNPLPPPPPPQEAEGAKISSSGGGGGGSTGTAVVGGSPTQLDPKAAAAAAAEARMARFVPPRGAASAAPLPKPL